MNIFTLLLVSTACICQAFASYWLEGGGGGGGSHNLVGVPDLDHYGKLEYPKFELQELGTETHGEIPPKTVKILKTISYKVPQPYPVHIPYEVPYPVHVEKPIPVIHTKIVKINQPFPVPADKGIPSGEFQPPLESGGGGDWSSSGSDGTFGGSFSEPSTGGGGVQQLQQSYGVPGHEPGIPLSAEDFGSFGGGGGGEDHGAEDRSGTYETVAQPQVEQGGEQIQQEQH